MTDVTDLKYSKDNILGLVLHLKRSSDPEAERYINVFESVYGQYWNNRPLHHNKAVRAQQWHGFEVEVISFLWLADNKFNIFSADEKIDLETNYQFSRYFSLGGLMNARLGLCIGACECLEDPPFKSAYSWWEAILKEQLDRSMSDTGDMPHKKKEMHSLEIKQIARMQAEIENGGKVKKCHVVCELISLSRNIIRMQEESNDYTFRSRCWNAYITARKNHAKFMTSKEVIPCGIVGGFFMLRKGGNRHFLAIRSNTERFKSGRGRKKSK